MAKRALDLTFIYECDEWGHRNGEHIVCYGKKEMWGIFHANDQTVGRPLSWQAHLLQRVTRGAHTQA